jgi:hypothetical protein
MRPLEFISEKIKDWVTSLKYVKYINPQVFEIVKKEPKLLYKLTISFLLSALISQVNKVENENHST